jgi:catechol 2,3-dioxygenase-like lactoylglutathione lyase family enzyme
MMNSPVETSVQDLRVFLPARDFGASREFYAALGFAEVWASEKLVLLRAGRFAFFLQDYFVKEWAENMMLDLRVADVDAYWAALQGLPLPERLQGMVRMVAPRDDTASGIRRGAFTDPSGVLWHFSQALQA